MLDIYQAQQILLEHTKPINKIEIIPIENANNRVLAQDIKATFDMPRFNNSAMDGYGIKISDTGKKVTIINKTLAGDKKISIQEGECIKIMTGSAVDDSVEAIVPIEYVTIKENSIILPEDIKYYANIRPQGEEFKKGDILLKKGEILNPSKIALIASLGITHIQVFQKPNILVIPTGNEIKNHYENISDTEHFNSSSIYFSLQNLANITIAPIANDNIETIKSLIDPTYDLIITTGGVSKGDADFTTEAFRQSGYDIKFSWIAIKPGKPFGFAVKNDKIATLLTGNPLAAVFNFNIFVLPMIRKLAGCKDFYIDYILLPSTNTLKRKAGRDEVIPVQLSQQGVVLSSKRGSGMISVTSKSDGIIIINKASWEISKNQLLKFINFQYWTDSFQEFIS